MKKIYFKLLVLILTIALFSNALHAQPTPALPTGDGTTGSPYQINTIAKLYWITAPGTVDGLTQAQRWTRHYIQTADIDASGTETWDGEAGWFPIGTYETQFTGNYNGQSYIINGLFVNRTTIDDVGFFGYIGYGAEIMNVSLNNLSITGSYWAGAIAGENEGTITNCTVSGSLGVTVSGGNEDVGLLVGLNFGGTITYSSASGTVKGLSAANIGGFVGNNTGTISYCSSSGDLSFTGNYRSAIAGGFVGYNAGSINNSYSLAQVTGATETRTQAGGFAATNINTITNCYSTGTVTGGSAAGFVSTNTGGTLTSCFWDSQTSGIATGTFGTPLTTAQMKTKTSFTSASWNFLDVWAIQASVNNGYPFLPDWYIWQGGSTGWTTGANWNKGSAPGENDYISISSKANNPTISSSTIINYMVIGSGAELTVSSANTLTIKTSGMLTVTPGAKLTSSGTITNSAGASGFLIESDDTGTGSIILNNTGVQATVQRYITPSSTSVLFHLVSTPVTGQTIKSFIDDNKSVIAFSVSAGNVYAMRTYKTDGLGWDSYYNGTELTEVLLGTGYSIGVKFNATTLVFKGYLVSSEQTKTIIGTGTGFGWNSIGNPFASSLNISADANSFLDNYGDQLDGTYYGLYIWNPALGVSGEYEVINSVPGSPSHLALAQGFIVKGKSGGGSVTFETGMRAHQSPSFYKSAMVNEEWSKVTLMIENASAKVLNTTFAFNSEMTTDFDVSYDAGFMTSDETYNVFTMMPIEGNDLKLMVQALPNNWDEPVVIPLGLQYDAGGSVEFSISSTTLPEFVEVWLEDREQNIFTRITTENYSTSIEVGASAIGRFYLHIGQAITEVDIITEDDLKYCEGESISATLWASTAGTSYKWYKDEELIPEANSKTLDIVSAGSYKVEVILGGSSVVSDVLAVTPTPLPDVTLTTSDKLDYCEGEEIDFDIMASTGADEYIWFKDGAILEDESSATLNVNLPGRYTVAITANGCSAESEFKDVVVNPLPEFTLAEEEISITSQDEHLFDAGEGFASYLWFDESTAQTYLFVGSEWEIGSYDVWVEVTNEFGCATRDTAIVVLGTTSIEQNDWTMRLYPNPSKGEINLNINGLTSNEVTVSIVNTNGQIVYQKDFSNFNGELREIIDLKDKAKGVHIIYISDGINKLTRRIVIE